MAAAETWVGVRHECPADLLVLKWLSFRSLKGATPSCLLVKLLGFFGLVFFWGWGGESSGILIVSFWQGRPKPHFSKTLPNHNYTLKIEYKYLLHKNRFHYKYEHCVLCISRWIAIRSVFFGLKQCQKLFDTCFYIFSRDSLQRLLCEASLCTQLHD